MPLLREAHDGEGLIVGVCSALDECAGVRVAPDDLRVELRRWSAGEVFEGLHARSRRRVGRGHAACAARLSRCLSFVYLRFGG